MPPPCDPPPAGIVAWWQGEGNGVDIVGSNNATVPAGVTYTNGEVGQGFDFNATANLTVADAPSLNPTNQLTIEYWVYPGACPSSVTWAQGLVTKDGLCSGVRQYWTGIGDHQTNVGSGDFRGGIWLSSGLVVVNGATVVQTNTWYHVAWTYDGLMFKVYVNGALDGQAPASGSIVTGSEPVRIGGGEGSGCIPYYFNGILDEPSMYNRALSQAEIAAIYNAGSAGKCTSATISSGPPAILNFSPATGNDGTVVTISGTNFSSTVASDIVYFGAVQAAVSSANPTSLTVTVPPGATFAPITVTVGGLTAYSAQLFEPTFAGTGTNITSAAFAPSFNLTTGGSPGSAIIADLDGDGKPDIALVSSDNQAVSIFRNISTNGALLSAASFAPRVDLSFPTNGTGGDAYRIRAVDLDGDGKLDLIACEVNGNRVSVFHNTSTPGSLTTNSFAPAFALIAGNDCRFATAADLDGDGRLDIVALNFGDNTISLFKNNGPAGSLSANSFAPPVTMAAPGGPYDVVIADLDGDGKPDLAVANANSGTVSIYQNAATPGIIATNSFLPGFDLPAGSGPDSIVAVDLDGDGKLDLAVCSVQSDYVSVFRNIGSGGQLTTNSFAPRVDFGTPGWAHVVSVADFNGDGKPDLAVVGELPSYLAVFQNVSTPGGFTSSSLAPQVDFGTGWNAWGVAAGDLDGDGRPDIVFCNDYDSNIQIYQNEIPLAATSAMPPVITQVAPNVGLPGTSVTISGSNFSATAAADIVYFGAVQAAVSSASPTNLTAIVPSGATYAPITVTVNGLVAYSTAAFEPTFAGSGAAIDNSTFAPGFNLPTGNGPYRVVMADLDGDGRPDLVVVNGYDNTFSIYQNIGTNGGLNASSFAAPIVIPVASNASPAGLAAADVNGDGKLDLVVSDNNNNQIAIFQNISSGGILTSNSFAAPVYFPVGTNPRELVVRDLDGDGLPDIVCANSGSGTVSILRNLGSAGSISTNSFAPHVDLALAGTSEGLAVGDLDGDGKPDLAVADSSGFISLFRNNCTPGNIGTNTFDARVDLPAQSGSLNVVIGDLDGDGKPELITSAYLPQTMSVYRNLATPGSLTTSSFAAEIDYPLAGRGHTIALSDLNGDGKPDIAEVTELDSALSVFQNIGTGSFTNTSLAARVDFGAGWNAWGVAVGDLDGDGRPDVVFANSYDNTLTIYKNCLSLRNTAGHHSATDKPECRRRQLRYIQCHRPRHSAAHLSMVFQRHQSYWSHQFHS